MSEWLPIETAPRNDPQATIDIWAKRWDCSSDTFVYRRFTDIWRNGRGDWFGPHNEEQTMGWRPTHWMRRPEPPST